MNHFQGFFADDGWEDCSVFEEDYWPNGREMVTVAMILSQLIWPESSLVWSASSDELVQGEGHLVLGTGVLHILPGYGCGVGHGADVRHATLSPTYDRGTCVKPGKFRVLLTVCLNLMPI